MNFIDFIFKFLANFLEFTPDEAEGVRQEALKSWENATGPIKEFLTRPAVLIMLPLILPLAVKGINWLAAKYFRDVDGDGEIDLADLLAAAAEKMRGQNAQLTNNQKQIRA